VAAPAQSNSSLLLPYALPYVLYVGSAAAAPPELAREWVYGLQIALAGGALLWATRRTGRLRGPRLLLPSLGAGVLAGLAGALLWIAGHDQFAEPERERQGALAHALRALAVVGVVPILEEKLMRGYALGLATQWDRARRAGDPSPWDAAFHGRSIHALEPGACTLLAAVLSSALFSAGHLFTEWPVAFVYGLAMAALWRLRKDLASCVAAHATTNAVQWLYALGAWH
jgi:uncharacterized protein